MKTIKWSGVISGLLLGIASVSFGQYGPGNGYGQSYPNGTTCPPAYPNGYGQNYPNQSYPNVYNNGYNGYGQSYPNGYGQAYPNGNYGYNQYGQPYPVQPQVVVVPPRVVIAPPPVVYGPPVVVRPYVGYGYGGGYGAVVAMVIVVTAGR
ncbi:hypothetical protein [Spirosoma telluris]|uniref:hypothetical protein n=1 Tax=Spirosoma telluris TaxID=2183553 RepID=UPI0018DC70BB